MKDDDVQKIRSEDNLGNMILEVSRFNKRFAKENKYQIGDLVLYCGKGDMTVVKEGDCYIVKNTICGKVKETHQTTEVLGLFDWYYTIETDDGEIHPNIMEKNLLPIHYIRTSSR